MPCIHEEINDVSCLGAGVTHCGLAQTFLNDKRPHYCFLSLSRWHLSQFTREAAKYRDEYVCYVCLSVCSRRLTRKPHGRTSPNFFMYVAWGHCSVFLIALWCIKYFWLHSMEPVGYDPARRYVSNKFARWRYEFDVRQLQCLVKFIRV